MDAKPINCIWGDNNCDDVADTDWGFDINDWYVDLNNTPNSPKLMNKKCANTYPKMVNIDNNTVFDEYLWVDENTGLVQGGSYNTYCAVSSTTYEFEIGSYCGNPATTIRIDYYQPGDSKQTTRCYGSISSAVDFMKNLHANGCTKMSAWQDNYTCNDFGSYTKYE